MSTALTRARAAARETAKRHVRPEHRHQLRWLKREVRLESRAIRNGVSPVAVARHRLLRRDDSLRFKGVDVQAIDPKLTWMVARDLWSHEEYDLAGYAPEAGWRVVDIGGNVGLFAMHAASRGAKVVSYEPHPDLARCLRANTSKWGVELHEAAVVGEPVEHVTLYVNPDFDIRHTLLAKDVRTGEALADGLDVPAIAVRDVLAEPVDLLKIDCEGGEFEILAHAGETLRNAARIVAEIHLNIGSLEQAVSYVEAAGFTVDARPSEHLGSPYAILTATRKPA